MHVADNKGYDENHRLYKIRPSVELVNRNCKAVFRSSRNVPIDESMAPFRGRANLRQ